MREDVPAWPPAAKRSTSRTLSPSDALETAAAIPAGPAPAMMMSYCWCFGTVWKPRASATRRTVGFWSGVPSTDTVMPVSGYHPCCSIHQRGAYESAAETWLSSPTNFSLIMAHHSVSAPSIHFPIMKSSPSRLRNIASFCPTTGVTSFSFIYAARRLMRESFSVRSMPTS